MDEDIDNLDMAMEHLKLKKPQEYGILGSFTPRNTAAAKPKPFKSKQGGTGTNRISKPKGSDSFNYVSVIKSNNDSRDMMQELNFEDNENLN